MFLMFMNNVLDMCLYFMLFVKRKKKKTMPDCVKQY